MSFPKYAGAFDIETKGLANNTFILSLGAAVFDVDTLQLVDMFDYRCSPNDPTQVDRTETAHTIDWWNNAGADKFHPTMEAKAISWGGDGELVECLIQFRAWLVGVCNKCGIAPLDLRLGCKGPDFDYVIMADAIRRHYRQPQPLPDQPYDELVHGRFPWYARSMDSVRTAETVNRALGNKRDYALLSHYSPHGRIIPHTAIDDALTEGYDMAQFYRSIKIMSGN